MPRGKEPSWAMETTIWDLASKLGARPEVMLRDLEKLCRKDGPLESEFPPDPRTVKRVIEKLQTLKVDILATLPRRIWQLRKDYNTIRDELEREVGIELDPETDLGYQYEDSPVAGFLPLVRVVARSGMKGGVYGGELKGSRSPEEREARAASLLGRGEKRQNPPLPSFLKRHIEFMEKVFREDKSRYLGAKG